MSKRKKKQIKQLSDPQRLVLLHLATNPRVTISARPPFMPPSWNHWQNGKTPRITSSIFNALHMRELIHSIEHRPSEFGLPETYVYQISPKGELALLQRMVA